MTLKDAAIRSTQTHIYTLITEQIVTFYLDYPDNKDLVNQTAGMRQFCSYSARGLPHSTAILFTFTDLPMQKFDQTSQRWACGN